MARIFTILSITAVIMIVAAGLSTYWLALPDLHQAKFEVKQIQAQGIATSLSARIADLQNNVDALAELPQVSATLERNDPLERQALAEELQPLIPHIMALRILPRNVQDPDESRTPHMGFADLSLAKQALETPQPAIVQGSGEHRHLALASAVKRNDEVLGVLLASLRFDFLNNTVTHSGTDEGRIELRQQSTVLAELGQAENVTEEENVVDVPRLTWKVYYWPAADSGISGFSLIAASIALAALFSCLVFFMTYRKLTDFISRDQSTILNAAKDLLAGKISGNYPVVLDEMKPVITNMVQYKRVVDQPLDGVIDKQDDSDDGFFDEGLESSFLDINRGIEVADPEEDAAASKSNISADDSFAITLPDLQSAEPPADTGTIFKQYDIRGRVGRGLTPEMMHQIGQAIGSDAAGHGIGHIVLARDGRHSSASLADAVSKGLAATGRDIIDLGLVPTPVLYFVAHHSEGRSGVMVTGSHNPPEYNGLKIVINGETLSGERIQQLKHRIDAEDYVVEKPGSVEQNNQFVNEYIGLIAEDIHIERPMKVVVDCGNGAAGELAPVLLKTIGCDVIELFCEIDGDFPNHHPDPSRPENLHDLSTTVKHHQADIGIALDGDGDRLGVVDSQGKIIWPDRQMMLLAKHVLRNKPGSEVIFDVKCSKHLPEQIGKYGGRALMWKTGHSLMKAKLKETGAVLAGEMSGHIIFNDRWPGFDDGLYAAARMIEILAADSRSSSEVFGDFPDSPNTPELNIEIGASESAVFMSELRETVRQNNDGKIIDIDGLRIEFEDGWGLVRPSNTTPSLVVRFEADTPEALQRIQELFSQWMRAAKPDIALPF